VTTGSDSGHAPEKPARRGLSKLRGEPAEGFSAEPVEPQEVLEQPSSVVVTLTKPEAQPATPPTRRSGKGLLAALIALVVAVAVLGVFVAVNWDGKDSKAKSATSAAGFGGTPDERLIALRAARQFTVSFFTYDYRKIDAYFKRIEVASTGDFRKDFVSKEKTLKTVVTQLKTVATGQVPDAGAGLSTLDGDKATALIAANFNASNAVTKNGQKRYRVKITMQRIKGNWLITNLDQVI
jgi:hypothetical protein